MGTGTIESEQYFYMGKALNTNKVVTPEIDKSGALIEQVEAIRLVANAGLDESRRSQLGQFMTPPPVARLMAEMFDDLSGDIHLLDAGAGVGSLTAALVEEVRSRNMPADSITTNAYELEPFLIPCLEETKLLCKTACKQVGIPFSSKVFHRDFIEEATSMLRGDLFSRRIQPRFNKAILNPPYHKINSNSKTRELLRSVGIETSNLYTAFLALAIKLLEVDGELVAITPRSFCNGPYFKPFRKLLLGEMTITHIHIFHARNKAFKGDDVLQENIIFHAVKNRASCSILISSSACADDSGVDRRRVDQCDVINPDDPDLFIHIPTGGADDNAALLVRGLPATLENLGVQVSTGRVVDFRSKGSLRKKPGKMTAPLIYPAHFEDGFIAWPKLGGRKANAIADTSETSTLLVPRGIYVLVKRFSSKEERRRVVAAIYDPRRIDADRIGFENHLNYFHVCGDGLTMNLAKGLALFLNSTVVDQYFRQFSGHTQVNATDLRSLRYPSAEQLKRLGNRVKNKMPDQAHIDAIIKEALFTG